MRHVSLIVEQKLLAACSVSAEALQTSRIYRLNPQLRHLLIRHTNKSEKSRIRHGGITMESEA